MKKNLKLYLEMQMLLITLASILQEHGRSLSYSGMQPMLVKLSMGMFSPTGLQNEGNI